MPSAPAGRAHLACSLVTLLCAFPRPAASEAQRPPWPYEYVCPVPGSRLVSPANNVILRPGGVLYPEQLRQIAVTATGSLSGQHAGTLSLSDDSRTLIFEPDQPFAPGEEVTVRVGRAYGERGLGIISPLEFDFFVSPIAPSLSANLAIERSLADRPELASWWSGEPARGRAPATVRNFAPEEPDAGPLLSTGALLPPGFPFLQVMGVPDHPSPGYVFMALFSRFATQVPGNLTIVDNAATPIFYRRLVTPAVDFKRQPDGRLTYFTLGTPGTATPRFYALDSAYAAVDSFAAGNGYTTDSHDLQLLPDGHALLLAYDPEPVRMDSVVPGGNPSATVIGAVLQELDRAHRVVFQWRSWDHFAITDLASPGQDLRAAVIDWVHANAVEPDLDGNLLLSSRHLSEITKIDRRTGDVIWRMGPHARANEFTFVGDPRGFSHQHDVRRLPDGHLTLFDNGNYVQPERSRAVEYEVDEANRVATEVWEFRHVPDLYSPFMGDVQRLPDGGTMIGWGGQGNGAKLTELRPDGTTTSFELAYGSQWIWSYRAFRFPWRTTRFLVDPADLDFGEVPLGASSVLPVTVRNPGPDPIVINSFELSGSPRFTCPDAPPLTLAAGATARVSVAIAPLTPGELQGRLVLAAVTSTERIAQPIELRATGAAAGAGRIATLDASPARTPLEAARGAQALSLAAHVEDRGEGALFFYTLPRASEVRLEIFGVRGRRRAIVVEAPQPGGDHVVEWRASGCPSGIYFGRLTAGGESVTRKFALIR
jgi:hypothetical protein